MLGCPCFLDGSVAPLTFPGVKWFRVNPRPIPHDPDLLWTCAVPGRYNLGKVRALTNATSTNPRCQASYLGIEKEVVLESSQQRWEITKGVKLPKSHAFLSTVPKLDEIIADTSQDSLRTVASTDVQFKIHTESYSNLQHMSMKCPPKKSAQDNMPVPRHASSTMRPFNSSKVISSQKRRSLAEIESNMEHQ